MTSTTREVMHPASTQRPALSAKRVQEEIAQRQEALIRVQADRDLERRALSETRTQIAALNARARSLELSLSAKNETAFLITTQLDRLQALATKVTERAQHAARTLEGASVAVVENRRAKPRTPVVVEVGLTTETNFYMGFTQDISAGGLFVATTDTRPIGTRFLLDCQLPGAARPIRCMVEVAWLREYHEGMEYDMGAVSGMGVKFVGLSPEDEAMIEAFQAERDSLFFPDGTEAAAC